MATIKTMKGPTLYPADRDLSKGWFVKYFHPEKKTYQKEYGNLRNLHTLEERLQEGAALIADITRRLNLMQHPESRDQLTMLVQQYYDFKCMGKKNKSVITYRSQVEEFCRWYRCEKGYLHGLEILGQSFLAFLSKKGLSNTTINNYRSNLSSIFRALVKAKKLAMNPFEYTNKQKESRKTLEWFRMEQIDELKQELIARDPQLWLACRMQFYCFIRPCAELMHLRVGDVQISDRRIKIRAGVGKSAGRDEYVMIPDCLLDELQELCRYPAHYYLLGVNGMPALKKPSRDGMSRRHNATLRNLNYPSTYSFYSWKNTGAVHMLKQGISILHISSMMRHKSLDYTKMYFKSLGFADIREDVNRLLPQL